MTDLDVSKMTPEQRLRQIEILLATAAKTINRNTEAIAANTEAAKLTDERLALISDLVWSTARVVEQQQVNIDRIWQYLNSRSGNGNSPQ